MGVLTAGCVGQPSPTETTADTSADTEYCGPTENGTTIPCDVAEHPPDIKFANHDTRTYEVSVTVTRNGTETVFTENMTATADSIRVFEDVAREPGVYTIDVSLGDGTTGTYDWTVGTEVLHGGTLVGIYITETGSVSITRLQVG
ncbi:hypothetical protein HTIA_1033 [Halorhabdus tiamatea SARL4B]|uniref:Ig-like domain-containing protein n=1 Tax=Halorhabdus tiamatea SARL4B TaxID=1033806 RepID=S6D828_9EURY|nr:hypothetical protein HTIA_1033 [Halorhabdus tiamatea SARL4B]